MRKYEQNQILEYIRTLHEATGEIRALILRGETDLAGQLLSDCQSMAVQVGNYIEQIEGEGTKTVGCLEKYCELLFQTSLQLQNSKNHADICEPLNGLLFKIEESVKTELKPNKIELVFVSYKASMSDSIESVYLAAKKDPACNAVFLPVPYFDINPDHTVGEMHYEGAEFYADNIEVTDWQKYNLEAVHPDAIFTFYPYDWANYVTRIHPYYFCSNMKKYTDLLVYLPYFVETNNRQTKFTVQVGVESADKIIVQSEKVRDYYIRSFIEDCGIDETTAAAKVLAMGSPKIDKVVNAKREDFRIPQAWQTIIGNKKVVLYNTSLNSILASSGEYLKKLRYMLNVFSKNKDIVLWWRPHPLSQSTFASLRTELLDEYLQIVEEYKNNKAGIFDTSADLHRAIAFADIMVSDPSSVATLFQVTGKPLLITNWQCSEALSKQTIEEYLHSDIPSPGIQILKIEDFAHKYPQWYAIWLTTKNSAANSQYVALQDYEYGISVFYNHFYNLDMEEATAKYIASLPTGNNSLWQFQPPVRLGEKLIFAPVIARCFAIYNLETQEWTFEKIPKSAYPSQKYGFAFGFVLLYDSDILFLPCENTTIAKYNIATDKITYHNEWYESLPGNIKHAKLEPISAVLPYGNSAMLVFQQSNTVLELNPKTVSITNTYVVGSNNSGFQSAQLILGTSTAYFIKFRGSKQKNSKETIVKWNILTGDVTEYSNLPISRRKGATMNALARFIYWQNELFAIPLQGDSVLRIDLDTDEIKRRSLSPKFDFFERKADFYNGWAKDVAMPIIFFYGNSMAYKVYLPYNYSLADLNLSKGELTNIHKWDIKGIDEQIKNQYTPPDKPLEENTFFTLEMFLDEACNKSFVSENAKRYTGTIENLGNVNGTSGQNIYNYIKSLIIQN